MTRKKREQRGIRIYPSAAEREQLSFICKALNTKPTEFLRSIISVHYEELNNIIDAQLKEITGERVTQQQDDAEAEPAGGEEVPQPEG